MSTASWQHLVGLGDQNLNAAMKGVVGGLYSGSGAGDRDSGGTENVWNVGHVDEFAIYFKPRPLTAMGLVDYHPLLT